MSKHIKTWQQRLEEHNSTNPVLKKKMGALWDAPDAMRAEIAELRAALATPPVASGALTDDALYNFWLYRDCMDAIRAGDMRAQFISAARAAIAASTAAAAPNAALVGALTALLGLIDEFGIKSGVCCCGDGMTRHDNPMDCGHSPVDSGEYYSAKPIEFARAALAQAGAA